MENEEQRNLESENPIPLTIKTVGPRVRTNLIAKKRSFRGIKKFIIKDPIIRRDLDTGGGFEKLLTQEEDEDVMRELANDYSAFQTALFVDAASDGNPEDVPALQTMNAQINENKDKLTKILEELEDCCEEIKRQLKQILRQLPIEATKIIRELEKRMDEQDVLLREVQEALGNLIKEEAEKTRRELQRQLQELLTELREKIDEIVRTVINEIRNLRRDLEARLNGIQSRLNGIAEQLILLTGEITALTASVTASRVTLLAAIGGVEATVLSQHVLTRAELWTHMNTVSGQIRADIREVNKSLMDLKKEFKEYLDEKLKELPEKVTDEVCVNIVGHPVSRWDAVSNFYPYIIFLFREVTVFNQPRTSQVKLRLKEKGSDINPETIEELKRAISVRKNLTYTYGPNRGLYVSSDKRFKTAVFGANLETIENLLKQLLPMISETYDRNNLTLTSGLGQRVNLNRRTTSLAGIPVNTVKYNEIMEMRLYRVIISANGLSKILELYKRQPE